MEISVIVPVYNVGLYIRRCLDSLVAQTLDDLEIILVDDGSTDDSSQICDDYASKYDNIRVVHKENGGLSDARNVGIDAAKGKYLGFIDPDDWVAPDFYSYLYAGIQDYKADVVVCEYYNVWEKSADATNRPAVRFFKGEDSLRALLLLKVGNYAWNKLYKRELFGEDIRYPQGKKYEDVQTTYRLFQRAASVVALPEAKYYYVRRSDSITGLKTVQNEGQCAHSRMVRYEALRDYVSQWPEVRDFLLDEIYNYVLAFRKAVCCASQTELDSEKQLFGDIASFLATHSEEICAMKGWGRLGRKAFSAMCVPSKASWCKSVKIEKLIDKKSKLVIKRSAASKDNAIDRLYVQNASLPIDENLAFVESRAGEDMAGNMLCIVKGLLGRGLDVCVCAKDDYVDKVKSILTSVDATAARIVLKASAEYDAAFSRAKYLFNDMVYPEHMIKRPGQVFVNTWHGTPLKMLEYDVVNQRHILGGATRGFLQCDYLVVPSDYLAEKLLSSASIEHLYEGEILCSGYPRNSVFFDSSCRKETRAKLGADNLEMFVYMPTWRGAQNAHVDVLGEYSSQAILDFFERTLADNQVMYVKLHNYAVCDVTYEGYEHVKPFPNDLDAYTVLNAADCLITDYSSVFFDYMCSGGKVILFTYDVESYLKDRGLYLDLNELPFPKVSDYDQLAAELDCVKRYDDRDFVAKYAAYDGIDSVERLLRVVIDQNRSGVRVEGVKSDGKKNVLLYDARYGMREFIFEGVQEYLNTVDVASAHYYYGYRQWCAKKTVKLLASLPEGIQPFALTNGTYQTTEEARIMKHKRAEGVPSTFAQHEVNRLFFNNPFDEIYIIDRNEYDPFTALLESLPNYKGAIETGTNSRCL